MDICESKINVKIPEVTHRIKNWYSDRKKIEKDFEFSGCNLAEASSKAKELEEKIIFNTKKSKNLVEKILPKFWENITTRV